MSWYKYNLRFDKPTIQKLEIKEKPLEIIEYVGIGGW